MLRLVAPAGTKITPAQVWHAWRDACLQNGVADGVSAMKAHLGAHNVFATASGRSALYLLLRALRALRPQRDVVAIPAYTCFSVPGAVVRAGLKLRLVEIDPVTFEFDWEPIEKAQPEKLLCVIATNLFGFANDMERLKAWAAKGGAFVVDDAAQAFGSVRKGVAAGMAGDAGIYSMGRGKPLFGMGGGLITTQSDAIAGAVQEQLRLCDEPHWAVDSLEALAKLTAYWLFFHPALYRAADRMPFLKLGVTEFDPAFAVRKLSRSGRALLAQSVESTGETNAIRRWNAGRIQAAGASPRFMFPQPAPDCVATYTRVPVLAIDAGARDHAVWELRRKGIGATEMYPSAICDIPGIDAYTDNGAIHCSRAEQLASRLFTLPTHAFLNDGDVSRIARVLGAC